MGTWSRMIVAGAFAAFGAGLALWSLGKDRPDGPSATWRPPPLAVRERQWSDRVALLTYAPVEAGSVRRILSEAISDPHGAAPGAVREKLAGTLAGLIDAWSQPDCGRYMAMADRDSTVWIGPEEVRSNWKRILAAYSEISDKPLRRDQPRQTLAELMDAALGPQRCRVTGLAEGPDGVLLRIGRARHPDGIVSTIPYQTPEFFWWYGGGAHVASFLRRPRTSAAEVLRRDGSVVYAEIHIRMMTERGRPTKWEGYLFYDPAAGAWQVHELAQRGAVGLPLYY